MASKRVTFLDDADPSDCSGLNKDLDPDTAKLLFETSATLFLIDVPPKTEIGIDVHSWNTGEKFLGLKMIPPGIHYVYWSAVSSEGQTGPRTGFFHDFKPREVRAHRYSPTDEEFSLKPVPEEELERLKASLKNLDSHLGAYPYRDWKKWVSLTNKISTDTVARLEPVSGIITSVSDLIPEEYHSSRTQAKEVNTQKRLKTTQEDWENDQLPKMEFRPGTQIRYTPLPTQKYPEGATPQEITRHSLDSTYQLEQLLHAFQRLYGDQVSSAMSDINQIDEVLAELQFSFICFLVGHHYDSFEQWKRMLAMICTCTEALSKYPQLYTTLITDLHFQIREVPDDFFVDIVSNNNFLVSVLTNFFAAIRTYSDRIDPVLKQKADRFKAHLTQKFKWDFDDDEGDEDKPVVVMLD